MAFTEEQKVKISAIIFETYATVNRLASSLIAEQEAFILERVALYPFNSFVRVKGGSDGLDFDNERKREGIRREIREIFGLAPIAEALSDNQLTQMIPTQAVF